MSAPNQHGLSRDIPEGVKREVRQRCGFGCVVCGSPFIQYDHLDPPFDEAREHSAAGIVALCGGCHDRKTRGLLSAETVAAANQNPKARAQGFSFGPLDVGIAPPEVRIGELVCVEVVDLISIDGEVVFSVAPPEVNGGPYRVSARLTHDEGTELMRIVNNEIQVCADTWDTEIEGTLFTVRRAARDIVLQMRTLPPHGLVVERLDLTYRGATVRVQQGRPSFIRTRSGIALAFHQMTIRGCQTGAAVFGDTILFGSPGASTHIAHMVIL